MPTKVSSLHQPLAEEPSTMTEKISDTKTQVKDKVSDVGHAAADKIDKNRDAAAGGLDNAATALHENAESLPGGEKVTSLAHATADKLSSTADYVREHNVNQMMAVLPHEEMLPKGSCRLLAVSEVLRTTEGDSPTVAVRWFEEREGRGRGKVGNLSLVFHFSIARVAGAVEMWESRRLLARFPKGLWKEWEACFWLSRLSTAPSFPQLSLP